MQHSVRQIGKEHEQFSEMRKDKKRFSAEGLVIFARENQNKYHLIENGCDFLVSTWDCDNLISDYKKSI
jgi:hypothetical protein